MSLCLHFTDFLAALRGKTNSTHDAAPTQKCLKFISSKSRAFNNTTVTPDRSSKDTPSSSPSPGGQRKHCVLHRLENHQQCGGVMKQGYCYCTEFPVRACPTVLFCDQMSELQLETSNQHFLSNLDPELNPSVV